jgi:hypothetical protein
MVSKKAARYRPRDTSSTCCNCYSMNDDGTCDRVEGIVECDFTCDLWNFRGEPSAVRS